MKRLLVAILLLGTVLIYAQDRTLLLNTKPIDPDKYSNYQGTPYLFANWVKAEILDNQARPFPPVFINYNGLDDEIEITTDKQNYVIADPAVHPVMQITDAKALEELDLDFLTSLRIIKKPNDKLPFNYYLELFQNDRFFLLYEFFATEYTLVQRPPGQIIEIQKLRKRDNLVLIRANSLLTFALNKKEIKKAFAFSSVDITQWAKKQKLNLTDHETIFKFLQHLSIN